ncbi:MAG TPA: VOC family protein [Myxococcaceae bacterium]|nr:VOC family protein [Myxococcaceae bacterium]
MTTHGFHHLAIQVRALEDVAGFYREVLGLAEIERHHAADGRLRSIWLDAGGGGFLALERVEAAPSPDPSFRDGRPGLFLVALRIARADRESIRAELEHRGVPLVHETRWTFYVRDPEGNRVALSHHPDG